MELLLKISQKDILRLPKKACPDNDFLYRRRRIIKNPSYSLLQSVFQVIITPLFKGKAAFLGPFLPVYPAAADSR